MATALARLDTLGRIMVRHGFRFSVTVTLWFIEYATHHDGYEPFSIYIRHDANEQQQNANVDLLEAYFKRWLLNETTSHSTDTK